MNTQPLKHLQVRQTQIESEVSALSKNLKELEAQLFEKNKQLTAIKREIYDITQLKPVVSEHALLRYCERILNIDLKKIEQELLSEKNIQIIEHIKSGKIPGDGYRMVVRNKVIITIES